MISGDETMRQTATKILLSACSVAVITGTLLMTPFTTAGADENTVAEGKAVAFDRKLGNCLACHAIAGGDLAGNIGPPLVNMKQRYPDKAALRAQIWDATVRNPNTIMPPFGRFNILTDKQIDEVVDFISTL
jgi:L-cysteine S-thiosulfotransferase